MTRPLIALRSLSRLAAAFSLAACATSASTNLSTEAPKPDPRVGLKGGLYDAGTALWNLKLVSTTPSSTKFVGGVNSDLSFTTHYVIQGSFSGFQVWDISDPASPKLTAGFFCPASQSDVSVYKNLLFVSGEGTGSRLDCGAEGVHEAVSAVRLRGIRIFDITDIAKPKYVGNVQTCRGSHTHTVVADPRDTANVYVYISGSAGVRSPQELAGCSALAPDQDQASARFRIEVIRVPLAHPELASIVSSPRIFNDLTQPIIHADPPADVAAAAKKAAEARAKGAFTVTEEGKEYVLRSSTADRLLDSIVAARHGSGPPTAADSGALRAAAQGIMDAMFGVVPPDANGRRPGPDQCHDITVYPAIGLAGGACEGYGLLLDIRDATHPSRMGAVSDSNFSYWHSATFNNDGTKLLFTDEWGGGGEPKCRATDRPEWGADAIFTLESGAMHFRSYYKMLAPQTIQEVCVAHNGSLIPIPGRDVMVQAWYEGGISVFDFTDASHPKEIAFFDRGPVDTLGLDGGGPWSSYWYNGYIVSSEIARGLDILELTPSGLISQHEIDAARSVHLAYFNAQSQPKFVWPASFALAGAYLDQLSRSNGLPADSVAAVRKELAGAEKLSGKARHDALAKLAAELTSDVAGATDGAKVRTMAIVVTELAAGD